MTRRLQNACFIALLGLSGCATLPHSSQRIIQEQTITREDQLIQEFNSAIDNFLKVYKPGTHLPMDEQRKVNLAYDAIRKRSRELVPEGFEDASTENLTRLLKLYQAAASSCTRLDEKSDGWFSIGSRVIYCQGPIRQELEKRE